MTIDWFLQCNISLLGHHLPIIVFLQIRSTSHSFQLKLNSTSVKLKIQMSSLNSLLLIECYCWGFVIVESSKMIICWIVVDVLTDGIISFVEIFISPELGTPAEVLAESLMIEEDCYYYFWCHFGAAKPTRRRSHLSKHENPVLGLDLQQSSDADFSRFDDSLFTGSAFTRYSARQSPGKFLVP